MLLHENNFMKRAIIKFPNWGSGFFSNYFCVISMLYEVEELGYEPYVDFTNTAFVEDYNPYFDESAPINTENPWDWWFYQKPLEIDSEHIFIQYSNNRFNVNKKIWESSELSKARYLKDKYTILRKPILDSVSSFFNKNFANRVVLGVMARGTEMNRIHPEYGNQTVHDYIKETKAVLKKHNEIDCIYLVTEDSATISAFQKEFPDLIYNKDVFRRTNEPLDYTISYPLWPCLDKSREKHCKILGEEIVKQPKSEQSYREILYPYMSDFYMKLGIQIIFGTKVDQPAMRLFLPLEFEKVLNTATQNGKKIAKPTKILNKETSTKPFSYINSIYSLLAAIVILIFINKKGIQITYFIFVGLLGVFISLVGFFSLHEEILWNYNILLFNPLLLLFAFFYWKRNTSKIILFGQICIGFTLIYLAYILGKVQVLIVLPIVILHLFWLIKIVMKYKKMKTQ